MKNKLYVGNISFQMDESGLEQSFAEFGQVQSVKIITDFETGRSKGFGFVEMGNEDEAQACIENLDGKEVGGRTIRVSVAKERNDRGGGGGGRFNRR
ncbi:MAG: RNA recognition motif domain-containing protein [Bacteriovoracaceae bacterium]